MEATNVTAVVPAVKICASVRLPKEVVFPHSNHAALVLPAGLMVPCNSAELEVIPAASFVAMDGLLSSEYPATALNKSTQKRIPKRPAYLTTFSPSFGHPGPA